MLLEAGLLLVLIPWSTYWDRNYLAALVPGLQEIVSSHYVRGAITGLGLVNVWTALAELTDLFLFTRRPRGDRP